MDAPFRGPRIGDGLTEEDYRRAEAQFRIFVHDIRRSGRTTLSREEYGDSNFQCNCGGLDYATRDRILREAGVSLPD